MFTTIQFLQSGAAIGAQSASGVSDAWLWAGDYNEFLLQYAVTAAKTDAADTLRMWVQTSLDGGASWHDVGRFADVAGNATVPVVRKMQFVTGVVDAAEEAKQDAAIAAGTVRDGPIGPWLRLKWTVTDADLDAEWTFAVTGCARG